MNDLGLTIEKPNDELYLLIKRIYDDIQNELELNVDFDPNILLGTSENFPYINKRALVESINGGSHCFITEGILARIKKGPNVLINNQKTFEGWRNDSN